MLKISNVLQTSQIAKNIISIHKLVNDNTEVALHEDSTELVNKNNSEVLMTGKYYGHFWWLEIEANKQESTSNLCLHNKLTIYRPIGAVCSVSPRKVTDDTSGGMG